ncbi:MAG: hypothetical protein ABI615_08355, partial [Chthoniobacterales bacterium]
MRFFATPDKHVHFDEIPAVGADWLKNISQAIESGRDSDTVESRLFPLPAEGAETEEICADWKAHVQPGLHEWFQSTSSLVREDVRGMKQEGDDFSLSIPVSHIGGWLNALNQARLVLAELHKLGEKDLNRKRRG